MLIKPTAEEAEAYIDFAYELALDPTRSGYPTYTDGIKNKEDFSYVCHNGLTQEGRQVLLYVEDGAVAGWIQFFFEIEDPYLQTNIFNIAGNTSKALNEFIVYCGEHFPGYKVYLGFPGDNKAAVNYLTSQNWSCEERSFNDVLFFNDYALLPESGDVVKIDRENYSHFRMLHQNVEGDMYWNSDRLLEDLDNWMIWLLYEEKKPAAAIYCRDAKILMEIFGVDFHVGIYREDAFRVLVAKALNECKRSGKKSMVFFNDAESQQAALELGFHCVGEYVLFAKQV